MASQSTDADDILSSVCRSAAQLISTATTPLQRISVRVGDIAVDLEWPIGIPAAPAAVPSDPPTVAEPSVAHVCAGMVGTFYCAPEPGAAPFVQVGEVVEPGQQLAILEAMKLMTSVAADRAGRVVAVLVPDGARVEYGEPLFALEPSS